MGIEQIKVKKKRKCQKNTTTISEKECIKKLNHRREQNELGKLVEKRGEQGSLMYSKRLYQ